MKHPQARLQVLAVWEPVLPLDLGPPRNSQLARLADGRVEQFWDKQRLTSTILRATAQKHPERLHAEDQKRLGEAKVVWDFIGFYPASVRWTDEGPFPSAYGHPVIEAIGEIEKQIEGTERESAGPARASGH